MDNEKLVPVDQDSFIDLNGKHSGGPLKSRRMIIGIVGTILIYLVCSNLPLATFGENCAKGLGFVAAAIFWMVVTPLDMTVAALMIMIFGSSLGVFAWADLGTQLGKSQFFTLLGMLIIANSLSYTPFAQRFAYWAIMKFGKKPVRLFLAIGIITSFLSWFMSNIGIALLMSGICNTLLIAMEEKPGESKFGCAVMSMVNMAAYFGGCVLIGGSPNGNIGGMSYMQTAAGEAFEVNVSYARWALSGIPSWIILIVPMLYVYIKYFKVDKADIKLMPESYYQEKLNALGKISGSEIRWVIIVLGMVISMLAGMSNAKAAILWALIAMLPGIGLKDCKTQLKSLPVGVLLCVCVLPILGTVITSTGVDSLIGSIFVPLIGNMGPLPFSMVCTLILFLLMNLLVNATHGAHVLAMGICVPVCLSLGYNPTTVLFPMLMAGGWFWCVGANYLMMMNHGYGWWEMKDNIVPGFIAGFLCVIIVPIVNYLVCLIAGLPLYL